MESNQDFRKEILPEDIGLERDEIFFGDLEEKEEEKRENLTPLQQIFLKNEVILEDNMSYVGHITEAKLEYTSNKSIPVIKISCNIIEKSINVDAEFALEINNEKYINFTLNKLLELFRMSHIPVSNKDFENEYTVLEACKKFVGEKVYVQQRHYNNFKKYDIVAFI